jgi:uncharacterized protein DUF1844
MLTFGSCGKRATGALHAHLAFTLERSAKGEAETFMADPTINFASFVLSLAATAAVHFGDRLEPGSHEPGNMDLQAAGQMIDILALLEEKTRGNLTPDEKQLLENVLYELRLRFIEVQGEEKRIITP